MNTKSTLRKELIARRRNSDRAKRTASDEKIFEAVTSSREYADCDSLLVYVSTDIEVGTIGIIKKALNDNKNVFCPRCVKGTNIMEFYHIFSFDDLEEGYCRIPEPKDGLELYAESASPLCIVPALAYDNNGYRIGFGKGFYDRFLSSFSGIKLGICYENCIIDSTCSDEYDVPVDIVVTEERTIIVKR